MDKFVHHQIAPYFSPSFVDVRCYFIQSRRGNQLLVYGGFCYRRDRGQSLQYWRCVKNSHKLKCYARVQTENNSVVRQVGYHTHEAEPFNFF